MTEWPSPDREVVYLPAPSQPTVPSEEERRVRLASARIRTGLPVSDSILDEILRKEGKRTGLFTQAERVEMDYGHELVGQAHEVLAGAEALLGQVHVSWLDGRRVARVLLTAQVDHYSKLLSERLGADRVLVEQTPLSAAEIAALQASLRDDRETLAEHGVFISQSGTGRNGFEIWYLARDQRTGERTLRERYGTDAILNYLGASNHTFSPFPFASWLAEEDLLHVFYALPVNGERAGHCQAFEDDRAVVVALTIKDWRGAKRLVGGFTPSHATVKLRNPLGERVVIDDSVNVARPHWTQL